MKAATGAAILGLVFAASSLGHAQEKRSGSTPRVQKFEEVERGFWLRSAFGISMALTDWFRGDSKQSPLWPPGAFIGLEIGVDLGQVASLHAALYGLHVPGIYSRQDRPDVANDAGTLMAMAGGRFHLATTKRLAWFLKAGGGYMLVVAEVASLDSGWVLQAGTGVEYATFLRHFSVGLETACNYLPAIGAFSILVTPTLKYVF